MLILAGAVGVLAAISWAVAMVSWILAVANRKPEIPLVAMLFSGYLAFDSANFTEKGAKHQRRFLIAFACFFLSIFVAVGVAAVSQG